MSREAYFNAMLETGLDVTPHILQGIELLSIKEEALRESIMFFIHRRLSRPLLKPALMRFSYELCGGREWTKILPACAAFELMNISSYQANSAFDDKLGILTKTEKDAQFIASMISREASMIIAAELSEIFSPLIVSKIQLALSEINKSIYVAQHYDMFRLNLDNCSLYTEEQEYFHDYRLRCYYGSGIFNGLCALVGALLAGANNDAMGYLHNFGTYFGIALQIANDVGDIVPQEKLSSCTRIFQDQGSDLRNGRLTLPVYLYAKQKGLKALLEVKQSLADPNEHVKTLTEFSKWIVESGSINIIRNEIKKHSKLARNTLAQFSDIPAKSHLLTMISGTLSNKYFTAFRKMYPPCTLYSDNCLNNKTRRKGSLKISLNRISCMISCEKYLI